MDPANHQDLTNNSLPPSRSSQSDADRRGPPGFPPATGSHPPVPSIFQWHTGSHASLPSPTHGFGMIINNFNGFLEDPSVSQLELEFQELLLGRQPSPPYMAPLAAHHCGAANDASYFLNSWNNVERFSDQSTSQGSLYPDFTQLGSHRQFPNHPSHQGILNPNFTQLGLQRQLGNYPSHQGSSNPNIWDPAVMAVNWLPTLPNSSRRNQTNLSMSNACFPSQFRPNNNSSWLSSDSHMNADRQGPFFPSLEELTGKIPFLAKDQTGIMFLHNKLHEGNPDEIHLIFSELKIHICDLIIDRWGNYLVQKMFEVCNPEQITQLLVILFQDEREFKCICLNVAGCRAVKKLLEQVKTSEQQSLATDAIKRITFFLTKNFSGHLLIQHCLERFPTEDKKEILDVIADSCINIATDKSGCCILQQCLGFIEGSCDRLVAELASYALMLSGDPYGNYVVQFLLSKKIPHVTSKIVNHVSGHFVCLSKDKFGSNVVERCIREAQEGDVVKIIEEVMNSSEFLEVLQNPYGNYVAQSMIECCTKEIVRSRLIQNILRHYASLHSHPHGKCILARIKTANKHQSK